MKKLLLLISFFIISTSFAASFDCSKSSTEVENLICYNPIVSSLDEKMANLYRVALENSSDKTSIRSEQKTWISTVRNKCDNDKCLTQAYNMRIVSLTELIDRTPHPIIDNDKSEVANSQNQKNTTSSDDFSTKQQQNQNLDADPKFNFDADPKFSIDGDKRYQ